jgi:hypothetical protein
VVYLILLKNTKQDAFTLRISIFKYKSHLAFLTHSNDPIVLKHEYPLSHDILSSSHSFISLKKINYSKYDHFSHFTGLINKNFKPWQIFDILSYLKPGKHFSTNLS